MADRVIFVCTLVLAAVYLYATEQLPTLDIGDPLGPKAFPRLLGAGLVLSAAMLLLEMRKARKAAATSGAASATDPRERAASIAVGAVAVWTLLYFLAFEALGYVAATAAYLLPLTAYFNRGKRLMNVLTSVLFALLTYLMFTRLLSVNLPAGVLPF